MRQRRIPSLSKIQGKLRLRTLRMLPPPPFNCQSQKTPHIYNDWCSNSRFHHKKLNESQIVFRFFAFVNICLFLPPLLPQQRVMQIHIDIQDDHRALCMLQQQHIFFHMDLALWKWMPAKRNGRSWDIWLVDVAAGPRIGRAYIKRPF